jgi:hypothetical protein
MKGFRQLRSSVLQGQWSSSPTVNRNRKLNRSTYEWKIWFGIEIHLDVLNWASSRHSNSFLDSNFNTLFLQRFRTSGGGLHSGELFRLIYSEEITFKSAVVNALCSHNLHQVKLKTITAFLSNGQVVERKNAPITRCLIFRVGVHALYKR